MGWIECEFRGRRLRMMSELASLEKLTPSKSIERAILR